jgi:hypothetical protein
MKSIEEIRLGYNGKNLSNFQINKRMLKIFFLKLLCTKLSHYLINLIPFTFNFLILTFILGYSSAIAIIFLTVNTIIYKIYIEKSYYEDIVPEIIKFNNELIVLKEIKK